MDPGSVPYMPGSRNSLEAAAAAGWVLLLSFPRSLRCCPEDASSRVPSVSIHLTSLVIFSTFVRGSCWRVRREKTSRVETTAMHDGNGGSVAKRLNRMFSQNIGGGGGGWSPRALRRKKLRLVIHKGPLSASHLPGNSNPGVKLTNR